MPFANLGEFLAHLKGVKTAAGGRFMALCPAHADKNQSLSVSLDTNKILLKCQAGCKTEDVVKAMGLEMRDLFLIPPGKPKPVRSPNADTKPSGEIDHVYQYTDESGKVVCETVKFKPKAFKQRRPDGKGGYIWNLQGIKPPLYRLPELLEGIKNKQVIFIPEGERDSESLRAWGIVATTNAMGAGTGKWKQEYSEVLRGADVVILADVDPPIENKPGEDPPGLAFAKEKGVSLTGVAGRVRLFVPPVKPVEISGKLHGQDITDWIEAGGTKEQFLKMVDELPTWEPGPGDKTRRAPLVEIQCSFVHLRQITTAALAALVAANNPPFLFIRAGLIVRVTRDENSSPAIEELSESGMRGTLERAANFIKLTAKDDTIPIPPPIEVVRDIMSLRDWPFPPLEGISETPTIRTDGTILSKPGYDPITRLYYVPAPGLNLPPIQEKPTMEDVKNSTELLKEIICDFPFDGEASLANAIAAIITPVLRPLISGPAPMTLFDKPQAGTGASLLADITSLIATGRSSAVLTAPSEDEDWRKSITSLLMLGRNVITIDNIEGRLSSPSLAAVLTSISWQDRVLGHSQMVILPHHVSWIGTGNNIRLAGDLPRRCFWVRMDAKEARPWQRKDFRHPHLVQWIIEKRGTIIIAILTIARSWILSGKPQVKDLPVMGSFETWVDLIGNVLDYAGIKGFLNNLEEMYETADEETPQWENFISVWLDQLHSNSYTVAELVGYLKTNKELGDAMPTDIADSIEDKGFTRKLGRALSKRSGVHYANNLTIYKGRVEHGAIKWNVSKWEKTPQTPQTPLFGNGNKLPETPSPEIQPEDHGKKGLETEPIKFTNNTIFEATGTLHKGGKDAQNDQNLFVEDEKLPLFEAEGRVGELIPSPTHENMEENIIYRGKGINPPKSKTPLLEISPEQQEILKKSEEVSRRLGMDVVHAHELWEAAGSPPLKLGDRTIEDLGEALIFEEFTDEELRKLTKWLKMQEGIRWEKLD